MSHNTLINQVIALAGTAGSKIMQFYKESDISLEIKDDNSPVTIADKEANAIIVKGLSMLDTKYPVVSEENTEEENQNAIQASTFWLVDPLDGTKSFIKETNEFTVNIALIENHIPTLGVIYIPAQDTYYYTTGEKHEVYKKVGQSKPQKIQANLINLEDELSVVASASHLTPETEEFIKKIKVKKKVSVSSSIKLCYVAEGIADVYPRMGRTMEWDIAAGHAILKAAGGKVETIDGKPFIYGKPPLDNPHFIAWGKLA